MKTVSRAAQAERLFLCPPRAPTTPCSPRGPQLSRETRGQVPLSDAAPQPPRSASTAADLTILSDVEAVRQRPGLWIGHTETAPWLLLWFVVGHALDRCAAARLQHLAIRLAHDDGLCVSGTGSPAPDALVEAVALELALQPPHASTPTLSHDLSPGHPWHRSRGAFGGGDLFVVNARSSRFIVDIRRSAGRWWKTSH